jgi:hypothetical protein
MCAVHRRNALSYISVDQRFAIHRSNAALMQSKREIEIRTVTGGLRNEKERMYFLNVSAASPTF